MVQAEVCADLGSRMYAEVLARVADDFAAGGVSQPLLTPYAEAGIADAVPLRLMGSVHRLVLERRAGTLATFYPSVGGRWEPEAGWQAFRQLLEAEPSAVAQWLDRPPQTNEVGRSAALMGGLLSLPDDVRLPLRLYEIGSSAGLNLLVDHFTFVDDGGRRYGAADDQLTFTDAWTGPPRRPWDDLSVIERGGCDVMPIDARSTEGRLALTAYVWADQIERLERLRAALRLAATESVHLHSQPAAEFIEDLDLRADATTAVWHSVMWQYLSAPEQRAIEMSLDRLGERADSTAPLVRISFEPTSRRPEERGIVVQLWRGRPEDGQRLLIGTAPPHGLPCEWNAESTDL